MDRQDLKELISRIIDKVEKEAPQTACLWSDNCDSPCDATTFYAVGEEG